MKTTLPRDQMKNCANCGFFYPVEESACPKCGHSFVKTEERRDPYLGKTIRDYTILEILAEGGMGKTYLARHNLLNSVRVFKIMHPWVAKHPDFPARFRSEAQLLSTLHHPSIVTLHEFSYVDEYTPFMVMEHLKGETIADYLMKNKKFPLNKALFYAVQICEGLHFAHLKGIIHRDISPENIILEPDDHGEITAKVIDFGIAKTFIDSAYNEEEEIQSTPHQVKTQTGFYIGKPGYGSPEQFRQISGIKKVDVRTDIFSFGIVLYEMITGLELFNKSSMTAYLLSLVIYAEKGFKSIELSLVPDEIKRIISHCIAYHPQERYESFDQLRQDLVALLDNDDRVAQHEERIEYRTQRLKSGKRSTGYLVPIIGIVFVAIVLFLGINGHWFTTEKPGISDSPLLSTVNSPTDPGNIPALTPTMNIVNEPTLSEKQLEEVEDLLVKLGDAERNKWFTTPEDKSVYAVGQKILEISPDHQTVKEAYQRIIDYYQEKGIEYFLRADFSRAKGFFSKGLLMAENDSILNKFATLAQNMTDSYGRKTVSGIQLLLIPSGDFIMGSPLSEEGRYPDEGPQHRISLDPFYLATTEVTNAQYNYFCKSSNNAIPPEPEPAWTGMGNYFTAFPHHPVVNVSWFDAQACARFYGLRLPTEAEWEYVARERSNKGPFAWGSATKPPPRFCNVADMALKKWRGLTMALIFEGYDDSFTFTAPAGSFSANAFGIFNMAGNVSEWCNDWYDGEYYGASPQRNPLGPANGKKKIVRGGSFISNPRYTRLAFRQNELPQKTYYNYGFRMAFSFLPDTPLHEQVQEILDSAANKDSAEASSENRMSDSDVKKGISIQ